MFLEKHVNRRGGRRDDVNHDISKMGIYQLFSINTNSRKNTEDEAELNCVSHFNYFWLTLFLNVLNFLQYIHICDHMTQVNRFNS